MPYFDKICFLLCQPMISMSYFDRVLFFIVSASTSQMPCFAIFLLF